MAKTIETMYEGGYTSKTTTPLNNEPVTVSATRFTPVDLLVSAYGSCLLGTIDYAANQGQFKTTLTRSAITLEMSEDKSRVGKMQIDIFLEGQYSPEQKDIMEEAAKTRCHVGNSLDSRIERTYHFHYS
ncbi:OsmC family protein [Dinghuibacter silviterrae]|uniref:OsmC-like protein n=1 Tax=Dinghuibacter silviterrae TaxID=1539049 RepID=A0A4R8DM21_9BACT|nr:OsmC family protein [Dinghuibacter silviterrae]TDW99009.1 OsmC-like protein [Dinghuibacter silviterrae]